MGIPSASQNAIIPSGQYIKTFKVMHKSQLQTLREGQALVSKKSTTKRGGTPCRNDKGASTPKSRKVIKDSGNKKNGRNEPVISPAHGTENASTPLLQLPFPSSPFPNSKQNKLLSCFLFLDIYCLIFQHWKGFTRENDSCKWHTLLKKQSGPKIIPLTRNIYSYVMHLEILVEFRVILNQSMRTRNSNLGT